MGEAIPCTGDKEPFALKGCPLGECKAPEAWQAFFLLRVLEFFFWGVDGCWDVELLEICFPYFLCVKNQGGMPKDL